MESRSLHRSQDMGQLQAIGPSRVRLALLDSRTGVAERGLWSGIDTTMGALQRMLQGRGLPVAIGTGAYVAQVERARRSEGGTRVRALLAADSILRAGVPGVAPAELADQFHRLTDAWVAAAGVLLDGRLDVPAPGPSARAALTCELRYPPGTLPPGCVVSGIGAPRSLAAQGPPSVNGDQGYVVLRGDLHLDTAGPTAPYYLRRRREGDLYSWPANPRLPPGVPFQPAPLVVVGIPGPDTGGEGIRVTREVTYRWNDQSLGEQRAPVEIVPEVDVTVHPPQLIARRGVTRSARVTVTLRHSGADTVRGSLHVGVPPGWRTPAPSPFVLGPHATADLSLSITPTAMAHDTVVVLTLRAVADSSSGPGAPRVWTEGRRVVRYPHIRSRGYLVPAEVRTTVLSLALPEVGRIGYVRGAADEVPEALRAAGLDVEVIPGAALAGSLARFGAIVIGPRAYEVDSALVRNNARLLAWARSGGRVIVQYQQYAFFFDQMAPFPLYVASRPPGTGAAPTVTSTPAAGGTLGAALLGGHDRVTDERAPVHVVDPRSPVLAGPNRIGPHDWDGWVQERGLYFARAWAPEYRSVLAMNDPGEAPLEGGLLIARVGKGSYIYTGLSFFRQLPAGVPGAFRLFANLLAVGGTR